MSTIPPILLVGLGKMGGAMLAGWRERGLAPSVAVDPMLPPSPGPEVTVVADAAAIPAGFKPAAIVLAVKPQNAAETLPLYARYAPDAVMLSIMAGRTLAGMRTLLGEGAARLTAAVLPSAKSPHRPSRRRYSRTNDPRTCVKEMTRCLNDLLTGPVELWCLPKKRHAC